MLAATFPRLPDDFAWNVRNHNGRFDLVTVLAPRTATAAFFGSRNRLTTGRWVRQRDGLQAWSLLEFLYDLPVAIPAETGKIDRLRLLVSKGLSLK